MFCCGGGRKSRTKADFIGALSDFNDVGVADGSGFCRTEDPRLRRTKVLDQGSGNGPKDDQPSAGNGDVVQMKRRVTYPTVLRKESGTTDDKLASQGLAWAYRPDPRYDGSELGTDKSVKSESIAGIPREDSWGQLSIGPGHTQAEGDYSRSPVWRYQESIGTATPDNGGSQYPGWIVQGSWTPTEQISRRPILKTKTSFQSDQSHQPEWLGNEPQTARSDFSQRPGWIEIERSPLKSAESEWRKHARAEHSRRERYSNLVSNNGPIIVDSESSTDYSPHRRGGTNSVFSRARDVQDDGGRAWGPGPTNGDTPEPTHDRLYRKPKGTWSPAPHARDDDGPNSPKTMGGESSSEVALRPPSEVAEISGERAKHSNQGGYFLSNATSSTSEESVANSSYHRTVLKETDASEALRVENQKAIRVSHKVRREQHRGTSGRQSPRQPTGEEPAPVSTRRKKEQSLSSKGSSEGEKSPGSGTTPPGDAGSSEQRNLRTGRSGTRGREHPPVHGHVRVIVSASPAKFIQGQIPYTSSTGTSGNGNGQSARQSPRQIDRGHGIHDRSGQSNRLRDVNPASNQRSDERSSSREVPSSSGIAATNTTQHEEYRFVEKRRMQPGPSEPDQLAIVASQSEGMGPGSRGPGQPLKDDGSSKRSRNRQGPMRGTPPLRNPRSTSAGRRLPPVFEEPSPPGIGRSRAVGIPSVTNTPANDPQHEDSPTTGWPHPLHLRPSLDRDDSNHSRRTRISRSSSMEEGSISSFQSRAMFSPDRFNAGAGAISWGGSTDGSWCAGSESVRSAITRGSSSQSVSSRTAEQERPKFVRPQLSMHDRQAIDRLKINQADLYFGYRPVRGSTKVYKVELNGEMRAAKVISVLHLSKEAKAIAMEAFYSELLQLRELESPNIVKVYGASVSAADVILVSEFVEGGTLRDLLENHSRRKKLNMRTRLCIAQDVAAGMRTLHMNGVQHCQLTSFCILLTQDWRAKIAGAGLLMTRELVGYAIDEEDASDNSLLWKAREVLAGAAFSDKSDVYSFGIVLWEIMQEDGSLPYAGLLPGEVMRLKYIGEGLPIPSSCSPTIGKLVQSCWSNLPTDRPSFEQIVDVLDYAVVSQRRMDGSPTRI